MAGDREYVELGGSAFPCPGALRWLTGSDRNTHVVVGERAHWHVAVVSGRFGTCLIEEQACEVAFKLDQRTKAMVRHVHFLRKQVTRSDSVLGWCRRSGKVCKVSIRRSSGDHPHVLLEGGIDPLRDEGDRHVLEVAVAG
ncbi:MAG: hypothetical protein ACRYHQ_30695 [Janthinobacterium lividum]